MNTTIFCTDCENYVQVGPTIHETGTVRNTTYVCDCVAYDLSKSGFEPSKPDVKKTFSERLPDHWIEEEIPQPEMTTDDE